jgi:hypothetical protein
MSATGRKSKTKPDDEQHVRHADDVYMTPLWLAEAAIDLLPRHVFSAGTAKPRVLDLGAGSGVWGIAVRSRYPQAKVTGIELRDMPRSDAYDRYECNLDALDERHPRHPMSTAIYHAAVGNPPYSLAEPFVRLAIRAVSATDGAVVMLLRLGFIAGQKRAAGLWKDHPPKLVAVCSKRPSFTPDGRSDASEYAVYVWKAGFTGQTQLTWL